MAAMVERFCYMGATDEREKSVSAFVACLPACLLACLVGRLFGCLADEQTNNRKQFPDSLFTAVSTVAAPPVVIVTIFALRR
jgi:hypothetical protein